MEQHNWQGRVCNWRCCVKCGLILLHNPFTRWCVERGCDYAEHPGFSAARAKYTKLDEVAKR